MSCQGEDECKRLMRESVKKKNERRKFEEMKAERRKSMELMDANQQVGQVAWHSEFGIVLTLCDVLDEQVLR